MRAPLFELCLNLCLAAASTVGLIALIEVGVRYGAVPPPFSLYPSPRNCLQRSALVGQELRPNCTGLLARTSFRTNAAGLRGAAIRDDGSRRILALGDSCTWGWQVSDDDSYPARLQQLLDQRVGAGRYQVLNAGVPGMTSYQGLQFLRARGLPLRPALVVAAYGFNDADAGGDVEELLRRQASVLPLLRLDDWLLDHSGAYKWVRWRVWYRQKRSLEERVAVDKYAGNLSEIVRLSRAHGAAVAFIAFATGSKHDAARATVAKELGVPIVRYEGPQMDVVHPTAAGYNALAADLFDRVKESLNLAPLAEPQEKN